ncbi:MAG: ATP-binding protein [Lachnospiraceae bacterium]|nr:ATP-binding protein [Lachnospiraceae bacterium]
MESVVGENLEVVRQANSQMLSYFQSIYITSLESLQSLKSESFEVDVKIEELEKTKNIYSFKTNDSKNIFSPLAAGTSSEHQRSRIIDTQLHDLYGAKAALSAKIATMEQELSSIKDKLDILGKAAKSLGQLSDDSFSADVKEESDVEENTEDSKKEVNHGYNILMLEEFHNEQMAHMLERFVKEPLSGNRNKQEVIGWLLKSDVDRARVTLDEIDKNTGEVLECVEDLIKRLRHPIDIKQPVWMMLDDFITRYRDLHPECVIEADIDCPETDISIPPIVIITMMQSLTEVFENVFKHSNANKLTVKIIISNRLVDVFVNDNGVGIQDNYLDTSKWYSGLHRLHEAIYLLDGKLKIDGNLLSGTNVRFSFPIKR